MTAEKKLAGIRKKWNERQTLIENSVGWLRDAEAKAEELYETSVILFHFLKKDVKDLVATYKLRYAKAQSKVASKHVRGRSKIEYGGAVFSGQPAIIDNASTKKKHRKYKRKNQDDASGIPLADMRH